MAQARYPRTNHISQHQRRRAHPRGLGNRPDVAGVPLASSLPGAFPGSVSVSPASSVAGRVTDGDTHGGLCSKVNFASLVRPRGPVTLRGQFAARSSGWQTVEFPGADYVLLHSLSHLLMLSLSLTCEYGSTALAERIYRELGPNRALRVVIYTGTEGTLWGLVP
jgi:hypothetical protein